MKTKGLAKPRWKGVVIQGDALRVVKSLPDNSIHCVITSPPYWQLRDYGWKGQWGLESTYEQYLEHLWSLMDEIKRVLKPDGTVWINLGDTYGTQGGNVRGVRHTSANTMSYRGNGSVLLKGNAIHKCQLLIPHRFAIGCIDRGWIIRNDIIWAKPNGRPESARDRFSKKHEYIFFMTKKPKYYFDLDSIRDPHKTSTIDRSVYAIAKFGSDPKNKRGITGKGIKRGSIPTKIELNPLGKNPGSVSDFWQVASKMSSAKHYAQYNVELITKPIIAGCPEGGIVLDPFFGVGTTGIQVMALGRKFIGIEGSKEFNREIQQRFKGNEVLFLKDDELDSYNLLNGISGPSFTNITQPDDLELEALALELELKLLDFAR